MEHNRVWSGPRYCGTTIGRSVNFLALRKQNTCSIFLTIFCTYLALCVTYRPDGKEVAVATLKGHITFFDPLSGDQVRCIEGRNDLSSGRAETDIVTAKKSLQGK